MILSDGSPILLYQIGTHEIRTLIDVPANLPAASSSAGGIQNHHLQTQIIPALPKCVQPSLSSALEKGKLRSMPNSFLPPSTNVAPGFVMLGDAMKMRHPLTGGAMTVALNDVMFLRDLLSPSEVPDLDDTSRVLKQMSRFHWRRKNLTSVINFLAQALYSLFAANGKQKFTFTAALPFFFSLQCNANKLMDTDPLPARPPKGLFPLLPTWQDPRFRSCWAASWHYPAAVPALLSFLRRRFACDEDFLAR